METKEQTREVDKMLKWLDDLKIEVQNLPYDENDIRSTFFYLLFDIGYSYYKGYMLFDIMEFIGDGKVTFDESVNFKPHIDRGLEIVYKQELYQSYYNSLNRNFLVSTWSAFELSVTTLCDRIATEEEKKELLNYQVNEIGKKLADEGGSINDFPELIKSLSKGHLTHVPIVRKTDFLFKKVQNCSKEDKAKYKDTLAFFGKFRNTIHTNFVYYGKDYKYNLLDKVDFVFNNDEVVQYTNERYVGSPEIYFDMKTLIKDVWKVIVTSIDYKEVISNTVKN